MHWYPWAKAFHIIFVISWYAGLLYLPRLFVYHTLTDDEPGKARFIVMERKLFAIMSVGFVGAAILGLAMVAVVWPASGSGGGYWLHVKLAMVVGLVIFHGWCHVTVRRFRDDANTRSHRYYRMMNEVPAVLMIGIVILVVVKPF